MAAPGNMLELQKLLANIVVVNGDSITFDFTDVLIKDNIFQVNANDTHDMNTGTAGFAIDRLTNDQVLFLWNEAVKAFQLKEGANLTDLQVKDLLASSLATTAYSLPTTDGTAGQVLKTDGAGNVTWGPDIAEGGAGIVWGAVSGTLSDQTDLQSALDAKADTTHTHSYSYATTDLTDWPVSVSTTELEYLNGATSSIQTQLDSMAKTDGSRQFSGSLIPDTDVVYDLGSATNRWRDLFLSGNTIDLGGAKISAGTGGAIKLPPNSVVDDGLGGNKPLTASNAEDMDSGTSTAGQTLVSDGLGGATWANQTLDGQNGTYYTTYADQAEAAAKAYADSIVATETTARTSADTTLQTNINTVSTNLATETTDRTTADTTLQSNIDAEAATRLANDNTLQSNIDAEASARAAADTTLQSNIDAEKGRIDAILTASTADKDTFAEIVTFINSVDTENDTALGTEITTRAAADTTLQTNITAEETARIAADTNLDNIKVNRAGDTLSGSLLVDTHNTYDLGSDTEQWKTAYFKKVDAGWKDLIGVPVIPQKALPGTAPLWTDLGNGVWAWSFSDALETSVYVDFHILHDIKVGSKLYPHIHWAPMGYSTGNVVWKIEYVMAKGHGQNESLAAPLTATSVTQAGKGLIGEHMVAEVTEANAFVTPEIDSIVRLKVSRDVNNVNDTYYGNVMLFLIDLHYEADRIASINKAPDFYGSEG